MKIEHKENEMYERLLDQCELRDLKLTSKQGEVAREICNSLSKLGVAGGKSLILELLSKC